MAGFVDAVGFLMTGGFFVSFMSGNSTRLAVGIAEGAPYAGLALGLIGAFVAGVSLGAFVGRRAGARRAPAVLGVVAVGLALAALLAGGPFAMAGLLLLAFAMGAENTVFAQDGEVRVGLTYMTGALVKLGKAITTALSGGDRLGWAPHLLLWLGLVLGAAFGAVAFEAFGARALWIAAGAAASLATVAFGLRIGQPQPSGA